MMPNASNVFQAAGRDSAVTFPMDGVHFGESTTRDFRGQTWLSAYCEKFFVKTANLARAIDKMNLEDPMSLFSVSAGISHAARIVRMHIERNLVSGNSLMRKMADQ